MAYISELAPGVDDSEVLALAVAEGRLLLTFDRDFGRLIFREGKAPPAGVIYLRFAVHEPVQPADRVLRLIEQASEILEGRYVVVGGEAVRIRPLPESKR